MADDIDRFGNGDDEDGDEDEDVGTAIERRELPSEEYIAPRLDYLTTEVFPRAAEIWNETGTGYVFVDTRLHIPDAQASRAALSLYEIDRETRRALQIIAGRGRYESQFDEEPAIYRVVERARAATPRRLIRPTPIPAGGFVLVRAEPGSADFFLDAYGLLSAVLLADPVQFSLTLNSIFGWPARVVIRRALRRGHQWDERDLKEEFEFKGKDLHLAGRLTPGSRLEFRYKGSDGSELETIFEPSSD
jgi:hypothetical protein